MMRPWSLMSGTAARTAAATPPTLMAEHEHAGVVDEDVELAEMARAVVHERFDLHRVGLVGLEGCGACAQILQFLDQRFGAVGGGRIADGDIGAIERQAARDGSTDTTRTAGDEGDFVGEGFGHAVLREDEWLVALAVE